jgi:hypothetical protein
MKSIIYSLIILTYAISSPAATIYVDANGTGDYPTIQSAINHASNNNQIILSPGTYVGNGNNGIDITNKSVTIRCYSGPSYCIIDCQLSDYGFYLRECSKVCIQGLTIKRGYFHSSSGQQGSGGAINSWKSNIDIRNCIFTECQAEHTGGAIYLSGTGNCTIENCLFEKCFAGVGGAGGIFHGCSSLTMKRCTFINNATYGSGGGIHSSMPAKFIDCIIEKNHASQGGGFCSYYVPQVLKRVVIINNSASSGGGVCTKSGKLLIKDSLIAGNLADSYSGGGGFKSESSMQTILNCSIVENQSSLGGGLCADDGSNLVVRNSIIWGNLAVQGSQIKAIHDPLIDVNYCDVQGSWPDYRNIIDDPCFVHVGHWEGKNWSEGDYSLTCNSFCINAGDPNYVPEPNETDLDGLPRVIGGRVDMGAYEFNHQPVAIAGPNQTAYALINGFSDVTLDGSASYDDDNDVLDYYWSWTIDGNVYEANGVSPTIFLPVGQHQIELVVNDGIDLSEPNCCVVNIIPPVEVDLQLSPPMFNTSSKGGQVIAQLTPPDGISAADIDNAEPLTFYPGQIQSQDTKLFESNNHGHKSACIKAFFDRNACRDNLNFGTNTVRVTGRLTTGQYFYGDADVTLIQTGRAADMRASKK